VIAFPLFKIPTLVYRHANTTSITSFTLLRTAYSWLAHVLARPDTRTNTNEVEWSKIYNIFWTHFPIYKL
jgi:hypothetical protein